MLNLKGTYKWRLINASTGVVDSVGQQDNLITDSLLYPQANVANFGLYFDEGRIFLSTTSTPLPSGEYRRYSKASYEISRDIVSSELDWSFDLPTRTSTVINNFSPPVSPLTINIMGLDVGSPSFWSNFVSFIELTTPITQQTNQNLYVEYSISLEYSGGSLSAADNNFVNQVMNNDMASTEISLDRFVYKLNEGNDRVKYTPFMQASDSNKVMRGLWYFGSFSGNPPNPGCMYAQSVSKNFSTTDYDGPVGVPVVQQSTYSLTCFGQFDSNLSASISRVYTHPSSQLDKIFSDPANPPQSRGIATISGTPTCKFPIIVRLRITKTGDASDITDETFTTDYTVDELTVGQDDWAVNDIVQVSSTGTLPSPLAASTDYYVVSKTGSSPSVKIELSATEGGSVIDLTDNGSGTHTISRQNSGRYRLELEPYLDEDRDYFSNLGQQYSGIDVDGNMRLEDFTSLFPSVQEIYTGWREGDYLYSIQSDAAGEYLNICRWTFYTAETAEAVYKFGTSGVKLWAALRGQGTYSDYVYIATDEGIYRFNISTPATPSLMSITGMIDSDIKDLTFDEVTEYLWAGHSTGLSRIDLSTDTATQYTSSSGPLAGINTNYLDISPGFLTAYNGNVVCCGVRNNSWFWYMVDGTGYALDPNAGSRNYWGATISKTDEDVIIREYTNARWAKYTVTGITGPNTGTFNLTENYDTGYAQYTGRKITKVEQISETKFVCVTGYFPGAHRTRLEVYEVGVGVSDISNSNFIGIEDRDLPHPEISQCRNLIDVSENNMGLFLLPQWQKLSNFIYPNPVQYGWNGSYWEKDNATDRQIPKTGTPAISHGLSVQFNNAVGEDWDKQFVLDERFTFLISPTLVKDNLQEYDVETRMYHCGVKRIVDYTTSIPGSAQYELTIPEKASDTDFREMDIVDIVTSVVEGSTSYSKYTLPSGVTYTANASTDTLNVGINIATGMPVYLESTTNFCPFPLFKRGVYFAINVSATEIKLAETYADALANTPIDIEDTGSGVQTLYLVDPAVMSTQEYYAGTTGIFIFASADAGKSIKLTYNYTVYF